MDVKIIEGRAPMSIGDAMCYLAQEVGRMVKSSPDGRSVYEHVGEGMVKSHGFCIEGRSFYQMLHECGGTNWVAVERVPKVGRCMFCGSRDTGIDREHAFCRNLRCRAYGPWNDPDAEKWNAVSDKFYS